MSSNTTETVWYENVAQGSLHEVVKGSPAEKRLKGELREVFEDGDDDPTFEPAYKRLSSGEVRKAQESPEKLPGYPAAHEAKREKAEGEKRRQEQRDAALDAAITGQAPVYGDQGSNDPKGRN